MEVRCTPAALTMMPSIRQRSEQQHRRLCPQLDPLPVERDAAPSIRPRSQRAALSHTPAWLAGARSNKSPGSGKAFHLQFFLASNSQIASERARAPRLAPWPREAARRMLRYD